MAGFKRRTLKELLEVDINKLTLESIQGYKKVARDEVSRGVKRWDKEKYKSPAWYKLAAETAGKMKISFRGKKTLQQQKKELAKAIRFLKDPTRLKKGWESFKKRNIKELNKQIQQPRDPETGMFIKKFTDKDFDRLYKAYNKAKQVNPNVALEKYKVMESVLSLVKDRKINVDELALQMAANTEKIYLENEKKYQESQETRSRRMS